MMQSSVKQKDISNALTLQYKDWDNKTNVIAIKHNDALTTTALITKQSTTWIVMLIVICLHAGLLHLILDSSPQSHPILVPPTITGVLIETPTKKVLKSAKIKPAPIPAAKPKPIPVAKKIDIPTPIEKKIADTKAQETDEVVENISEDIVEDITEKDISTEQVAAPIVAPRTDATRKSNPAPVYPRGSLRRHETGKVILDVLILVDGRVGDIRIKQSSGFKRLDRSAIKAVKRWRYTPAQQRGKAIEYWYQQPIAFSLRN